MRKRQPNEDSRNICIDGKYQMLGIYDTTTLHLDWYGKEKFSTMNGLPPPDSTLIQEWLLTVDLEVMFFLSN